jgi:hypothetical protein
MNGLKNLAGHDVACFLFRFEIQGNAISFAINQGIGEDMYPDIDEKMKPLAHACCETLSRYRHLSISPTIMDGNLLDTGEFEVMLSRGLGGHFADVEKQRLFHDAKKLADLLITVMNRRTREEKEGTQKTPAFKQYPQNISTITPQIKKGLEMLGDEKSLQAEFQWMVEGKKVRPGLKRLTPQDLPPGVEAARGYDHRGHCYVFAHKILGELGRIIIIKTPDDKTLLQAELYTGQENIKAPRFIRRKALFGKIVTTVNNHFDENFPEHPTS